MKKNFNNREIVEGRVYDHKLTLRVTGPKSKNPGTEFISGKVDIATDEAGLNVVPVKYTYVTPTTANGGVNKTFKLLKDIIESEPTIVKTGMEAALKVNASPSLACEDYYMENAKDPEKNPDGLVTSQVNSGGFLSTTTRLNPDESKRNQFEADILIKNVIEVSADEERGIKEDYIIIDALAFSYNGKTMYPVKFTVRSQNGINYFTSLGASPQNLIFTKVWGNICSTTVTRVIDTDDNVAFGVSAQREVSRTNKEWLIVGASANNFYDDSENGITAAELTELIAKRNTHLAEEKARVEEYRASQNAIGGNASPVVAAVGGNVPDFGF